MIKISEEKWAKLPQIDDRLTEKYRYAALNFHAYSQGTGVKILFSCGLMG